jgi:zinc protease
MPTTRTSHTSKASLFLIPLLTGFFIGCATPPSQKAETTEVVTGDWSVVPLLGDRKVYRTRLANGLKVIVVPDRSSPTFSYQTWFDVGSRDEEKGKTGLAHLFEHLMFKGTKTYPTGEFERRLDMAGAEGQNAFTSNDFTAYVQELPKERLGMIVELESDRMTQLVVDEKLFRTEREVVQNERRQRTENSPEGKMHQELYGLAYQVHPYHWPVIGYQEDLASMNHTDAEAFYRRHYHPGNAVVVIAGDVELSPTLALLKKFYGRIPAAKPLEKAPLPAEPVQLDIRRKNLELNSEVEKLMIAYKIPASGHADMPALSILDGILSGGRSARLPRTLTDTGISRSAWSHVAEGKDPGLFLAGATLQKGKKAVQAEKIILSEIRQIRERGVSREEVERTMNRLEFTLLEGLRTNKGVTEFIGESEITYGDFTRGLEVYRAMRAVTPEQVREVARAYLDPERRTVLIGVPKESPRTQL